MRVGLLALALREHGGIFQYTVSLMTALRRLGAAGEIDLRVLFREAYREWAEPLTPGSGVVGGGFVGEMKASLAMYLGAPLVRRRAAGLDVAVSPKTCVAGVRIARKNVITLHDMQHRRLPHFFSMRRRLQRDWLYRRSVKQADGIVCETEYVKRDIVEAYDANPEAIYVLPSPPPEYVIRIVIDEGVLQTVRRRYALPASYLFYPAQFWSHKNHQLLIRSMALLRDEYHVDVPLVLVGSQQENFKSTMLLVEELKLQRQVKYLGYVPDADMPYLFKGASALVIPSLFESLSIPVWEAFYLGVPVISSDACAFPEQVGSAGLLFNPYDPVDCAGKIRACLTDRALVGDLVVRGRERVKGLTTANYAEEWGRVLTAVVGR